MNFVQAYLNQIILLLFLAIAGWLGAQAKRLYQQYITTEIKQNVVRTVVRFVEQIYVDLHGPEKLAQAMAKASEILDGYGITIPESELVAMIEAAVNEFNDAFRRAGDQGQHLPGTPIPEARTEIPEPVSTATAAEIVAEMKDLD